jgi:hypothetical protein
MSRSNALLILLLVFALTVSIFGCATENETPSPTPISSPTPIPTPTPVLTPTPTPEPVTRVFNMSRTLSGLNITLVMCTWVANEVEVQWRIDNLNAESFNGSHLYSIFQPGAYAMDQTGREAEYFIPPPIRLDLEAGMSLTYKTSLLFYPESTNITIRLPDVWAENGNFTDISVEYSFPR